MKTQIGLPPWHRAPLPWIIAAEIILLAILGALTWQFAERYHVVPAIAALPGRIESLPAGLTAPSPSATPNLTSSPLPTGAAPPPNLAPDAITLNREEARWSMAQWSIIGALEGVARRYVESVVLPAINSARTHA
ncbi:MAG TPA: hypothetical protein VG015_06665 [Candidatus Dormibacteraeota bacterium]|jgi:hypothetical protein|nr:hypothetical protein [Candidatus Dormibacteraeota bacterium]